MRYLSFFLISFLYLSTAQAQNPFVGKDSVKINNITYDCWTSQSRISISNKQNISNREDFVMPRTIYQCEYANVNELVLKTVINSTFSPSRKDELKGTGLKVICYVKPSTGIIQEVQFVVTNSCPVTGEEVYALEQQLKGKQMYPQPACVSMQFTAFSVEL